MKATLLPILLGVALAGCGKKATVEGQAGEKLSLTKPSAVTLHRGGTSKSDVKITRKDLTGDVVIVFDKLPKGVDVIDADQRISGSGATFTLRASDTADLVENHLAQVTATGPGNIAVTQPIEINVKERQQ